MAPLLEDPRIRQNWNHISQNVETATETAAAGIWTIQHEYLEPCFASVSESLGHCTASCFPDRDERQRRDRTRTRGRAAYSFDFYDDWDEEEERHGGLLGWGNDELDRLLAGSGSGSRAVDEQPRRKRGMSYGTGKRGPRRKNTVDGMPDPTIIPSTTTLGFLQRLPFKIGGTLRYKPSAADLQDHPGHKVNAEEEGEALLDSDHLEEEGGQDQIRTRKRSSTIGSGDTSDSFRSRGDLFPSDGEDDAVPISDEFAMVLERRNANIGPDDRSSGKTKSSKGKRPAGSRTMSRTFSRTTQDSSHSRPGPLTRGSSASDIHRHPDLSSPILAQAPSLTDLQIEEELVRKEEEMEVEKNRVAAAKLALERGLSNGNESAAEPKHEMPVVNDVEGPDAHQGAEETASAHSTTSATDTAEIAKVPSKVPEADFVPARLPNF